MNSCPFLQSEKISRWSFCWCKQASILCLFHSMALLMRSVEIQCLLLSTPQASERGNSSLMISWHQTGLLPTDPIRHSPNRPSRRFNLRNVLFNQSEHTHKKGRHFPKGSFPASCHRLLLFRRLSWACLCNESIRPSFFGEWLHIG